MCMTRSILESLYFGTSDKTLNKVTPSKSLFIGAMPCEIKAARIRNSAVDSIEAKDVGEVSYRFLQARRGENVTLSESLFWGISTIVACKLFCTTPLSLLLLLPYVLHVPPNIYNTLRYGKTRKFCEEWLSQRLGGGKFARIKELKYSQEGLFKLTCFLKDEKIEPPSLEGKGKKENRVFSCWNLDG